MARFNGARRESVWFDTEIRKTPVFDAISAGAFGLWTRLPFLVEVVDDAHVHVLPDPAEIAQDGRLPEDDLASLLAELLAAGLVEVVSVIGPASGGQESSQGDRYCMTLLSQRYYALSEPEDEEAQR